MRIEGIAVVTGGASGIGHACCNELAERGASIVVLDRDHAAAKKVADQLGGIAIEADVGDDVSLRKAAEQVERDHGPVQVLVNSAGVMQIPLPPQSLPLQMYDDVIRIDLRGTYLACVAFGLPMVARRRGAIVNIASVAGFRSMPLHAYAPAKAAVISTTECLAAEWGPSQVRVNAVCPGYTLTPQLRARIERGERDVTALEKNAAMGRLVNPIEIARAVAFLASPLASAITGISLPVDCGWLVAPSWHSYGGLRAVETV
jgi:NAD(P)-dependent dehydrogenase (short-subunit alcohol dehydrogenase family)